MRSLDDIEILIAFFEARQGELFGFLVQLIDVPHLRVNAYDAV